MPPSPKDSGPNIAKKLGTKEVTELIKALTKFIDTVGKTVTGSYGYALREHVGIILICFFVFAIATIMSGILIYAGHVRTGATITIISIVVFVVAILILKPSTTPQVNPANLATKDDKTVTISGRWSRYTIELPLTMSVSHSIHAKLVRIRSCAQNKYKTLIDTRSEGKSPLNTDNVRVNIFLPEIREAVELGEVCGLFIPEGLTSGMKNPDEFRLKFRTNEGVTGRVFSEQRPIGATRKSGGEDWIRLDMEGMGEINDGEFRLTTQQRALIDPDLRWIISFPIKITINSTESTIGVLNIDGIAESLDSNELKQLYVAMTDEVKAISDCFQGMPKLLVTIFIDRLE